MNEIQHPISAEWLSAYHDGELDPARREQLAAHLQDCAACRRQLADWQALSQALTADELANGALANPTAFWSTVEAQLPDRAPAPVSEPGLPLRWLPGIGLLLANGLVQLGAAVGVLVMLVASLFPATAPWATRLDRLATDWLAGWLAWLWPIPWLGLGTIVVFVVVSAGLAVLYLAWLGYELRYGRYPLPRTVAQ